MFTNKKSLIALSVVSALALTACSSDDDNNTPEPAPVVVAPETPEELSAVVNVNVVDNSTSDVVQGEIAFYENGTPSQNVVDLDGNVVTSISTTDAGVSLQLEEDADISEVTAVVSAEGYLTKSYLVDLSGLSEGNLEVQLPLVAVETAGVAVEEAEVGVSGGSSADAIEVETSDGKAAASVTVPAGTTLQDAQGNPVTGDEVSLAVVAADTSSTAGATITPEGLNAANTADVLTPVGVASVEMVDNNGVKIKTFSQPITITMAIPEDKGYTTGDELALVSQDEDTGVWTQEDQKVTVGALVADENYYNASFETTHLTFFSAVESTPACNTAVRVLAAGDAVPTSGLFVNLTSTDADVKGRLNGGATDAVILSGEKAAKKGISADAQASVNVKDANGNVWYQSESEVAVCGDINVTLENPVSYVSETLAISAVCSNDSSKTTVATGALVKYSLTGKAKKVAQGESGSYALDDLVEGSTYEVSVQYKGSLKDLGTKSYSITADGTDEAITESIQCSTVTGGN